MSRINYYGFVKYSNILKYWNRYAWASSVASDQMPPDTASDQNLHCLPLIQQFIDTLTGGKMD